SAAVLVPTRSQVFRSLAFVLAESVEGACTMRLQASTRCWGVSWLAAPLWPLLAAGFVLDLDLLLLPHPTRSAPLRSATTRRVDSFRNDDPLLRGTFARPLPSCSAAILPIAPTRPRRKLQPIELPLGTGGSSQGWYYQRAG